MLHFWLHQILSSSEGNILEDESAIDTITSSKVLSVEIAEKQRIAVKTEARIDEARKGYIPVAVHVASLFFTIADLCCIDPMYQYSLTWYMGLFNNAMRDAEKSTQLATRLEILNTFFTYLLYSNISRSLFEKDKMLLSFLICTTIWLQQGKIMREDFNFLVMGGLAAAAEQPKNPAPWLLDKLWIEMNNLSALPNFVASVT
jgi:dynein heavy chain